MALRRMYIRNSYDIGTLVEFILWTSTAAHHILVERPERTDVFYDDTLI